MRNEFNNTQNYSQNQTVNASNCDTSCNEEVTNCCCNSGFHIDSSLLFFFLILVCIFKNSNCDVCCDTLLWFFLLLVVLMNKYCCNPCCR